jgi:hypothetical protein
MSQPTESLVAGAVAIILNEDFSGHLLAVTQRASVWIIDTVQNRTEAATLRASGPGTTRSVTTFKIEWSSAAERSYLIDTVLEHHPDCSHLEFFGTPIAEDLVGRLGGLGFLRTSRALSSSTPHVFVRNRAAESDAGRPD